MKYSRLQIYVTGGRGAILQNLAINFQNSQNMIENKNKKFEKLSG